jgi:hypothetical protein
MVREGGDRVMMELARRNVIHTTFARSTWVTL